MNTYKYNKYKAKYINYKNQYGGSHVQNNQSLRVLTLQENQENQERQERHKQDIQKLQNIPRDEIHQAQLQLEKYRLEHQKITTPGYSKDDQAVDTLDNIKRIIYSLDFQLKAILTIITEISPLPEIMTYLYTTDGEFNSMQARYNRRIGDCNLIIKNFEKIYNYYNIHKLVQTHLEYKHKHI